MTCSFMDQLIHPLNVGFFISLEDAAVLCFINLQQSWTHCFARESSTKVHTSTILNTLFLLKKVVYECREYWQVVQDAILHVHNYRQQHCRKQWTNSKADLNSTAFRKSSHMDAALNVPFTCQLGIGTEITYRRLQKILDNKIPPPTMINSHRWVVVGACSFVSLENCLFMSSKPQGFEFTSSYKEFIQLITSLSLGFAD
jgi:hypothetical protein